jgi:Aldehyde dehydrogenase family
MNIAQRVSVDPKVEKFLSAKRNLLIDGKWVPAKSGKTFPVYDPSAGAVMAQVAEADAADVDKAVKAARKAFEQGPWPRMSPSERGRILWKLADLIEKRSEEFATLESLDNGKPLTVARVADVPLTIDMFRYMAGWATKITGTTIPISFPGEYLILHAARTRWGGRPDHSMELPAVDGRMESGAGSCDRMHSNSQGRRADTALRPSVGRAVPRGRIAGRRRQRPCGLR